MAIVAGWALFFWGWHRVITRGTDFSELRTLMIGAAVVVPVITVSWILHNRGIYRRKGPRRRAGGAALDYRVDFHGRAVVADFRALAGAQRVEVVIEGAVKRYLEAATPPGGAGHAPTDLQAPASDLAAQARSAIDHASSQAGQRPAAADTGDPAVRQ
ncbi:MAG: hypothetical protein JNJ89_14745 [Rubrivivax sp.]|nr:hypothetical protein [Rubrivivax sp.]